MSASKRRKVCTAGSGSSRESETITWIKEFGDVTPPDAHVASDGYYVLTKEEIEECREDDLTPVQIKKKDQRKKDRITEIVFHNILEGNKLANVKTRDMPINIVAIGKTGHGKSATLNTLIGSKGAFEESDLADSCSQITKAARFKINRRAYQIVDTPGLFDTKRAQEDIRTEMAKCMDMCSSGVDVFLFVFNASTRRFSPEEQATIKEIKDLYGDETLKHMAAILTHTDTALAEKDLRTYIDNASTETGLSQFLKGDVSLRVMGVNNKAKTDYERQLYRSHMFDLIDVVIDHNKGEPYMDEHLKEAKRIREEGEAKRKAELDRKEKEERERCFQAREKIRDVANTKAKKYFAKMTSQQLSEHLSADLEEAFANVMKAVESAKKKSKDFQNNPIDATTFEQMVEQEVRAQAIERLSSALEQEKREAEKAKNKEQLRKLKEEKEKLEEEKCKAEKKQRELQQAIEKNEDERKDRYEKEKDKEVSYHKEIEEEGFFTKVGKGVDKAVNFVEDNVKKAIKGIFGF